MKIAIDARFYGLENAGLGRYTMHLLGELAKLDHKNEYFILLRDTYFKSLVFPSNFKKIKAEARHYSVKEQIIIPHILRTLRPDFVHFLHFNAPVLYKGPYLLTIHDLLMHNGVGRVATTLPQWKFLLKRSGYRLVFDNAVKRATKVIVPSVFVKEELKKTYNLSAKKAQVIYEGVSLTGTFTKALYKKSTPYFFYVGNAYPHKNLTTLIKAIALLNKTTPTHLLLVIPRDVFTSRLKSTIKDLNAEKYVTIKSGITDQKLISLYKNALALAYPSFSEGFGLQGIEAMSIGTRVVSSDIPVFHELYKDNAIYFDPHSVKSIKDALSVITEESSSTRKQKIREAKDFVKKYSWEEMAKETIKIYQGFRISLKK